MAFKIHSTNDGHMPPVQYLPANADTYVVGQALVWDAAAGILTAVTTGVGEDTDEGEHYICMQGKTVAADGDPLGVVRSDPSIIWDVPIQANDADLAPGLLYTIHTDGLQMTGTTTKGCCKVLEVDGRTAGDHVRVILA
jgi:hypothetical protein